MNPIVLSVALLLAFGQTEAFFGGSGGGMGSFMSMIPGGQGGAGGGGGGGMGSFMNMIPGGGGGGAGGASWLKYVPAKYKSMIPPSMLGGAGGQGAAGGAGAGASAGAGAGMNQLSQYAEMGEMMGL